MSAVIALAVLVGVVAVWLWYRFSRSRLLILAWRWFTGHPLDGYHRTNATWTRRADKVLHPTGRAVRWHHLPRLLRAGIRTGAFLCVLTVAGGLLYEPAATEGVLAALGAFVLLLGGWRVWRVASRASHYYKYERPLSRALARELEVAPPRLAIDRDRTRAVVGLPDDFTGSDREREAITRAVTVKLGIEAPDTAWELSGRRPQVVYTKSVPPPARVTPADIRGEIDAAAEHEVILGLGKKRQLVKVSLDTETPHIGLCMGTGDGKSTAAMNIAAQILYHGGLVVFLDYKLMSHMWARGLPNVAYAGTPAEIHQMMLWLAWDDYDDDGNMIRESELTRRKKVALASADIRGNVTADLGPRILIVAEELNATQKQLKRYWRRLGGKGPSPASEALDEVLFTGRQLRAHALQIAQRLSAKASGSDGSADGRENVGTIVFSNPTPSTWKMLCDGHTQPPASDHKGRYQVVSRKQVREMQGVWWDEEDAQAFATAGTVALPRSDMPLVTRVAPVAPGHELAHMVPDLPFVVRQAVPVAPRPPDAVTLREAADAGLFPSKSAAAKAVQRAQLQAAGQLGAANLYHLADLAAISQRVRSSR